MNTEQYDPNVLAPHSARKRLGEYFAGLQTLTVEDYSRLMTMAIRIKSGRFVVSRDLTFGAASPEAELDAGIPTTAAPSPALPSYAQLQGDRLTIDLTLAETAITNGALGAKLTVRHSAPPPTPARPSAPVLPSWAHLSPQGRLTVDLDKVDLLTIAVPADRQRLLIGPKNSVQIAFDSAQFDVTQRERAFGVDWLVTPKPAGAQ